MINFLRWKVVTTFELRDAFRSKLVVIIVTLFAAGAGLGAMGFIRSLQESERAARDFLATQANVPPESISVEAVRQRAMELLLSMVQDEQLREVLLNMQPLAIFFGYVAQNTVPLLVLVLSSGAHAADIARGATRFTLVRCDRPTWALGKLSGHAALLLLGLTVAALVCGACGAYAQPEFEPRTWGALLLASLRTFVYGFAYLGLFAGVSLLAGAPMRARVFSLLVLIACGVGHSLVSSAWVEQSAPLLAGAKWLFPAQYDTDLWLMSPGAFLPAVLALVAIGSVGFSIGVASFLRRDA